MQNWYLCRIVGETPADFKSYFYPLIIMNLAKIKSGVYYFMFSQFDAKSQVFSLFHCFVEWRENLWVLTIMQNIGTKYLHEIKILQNVLPCRKYDGHQSWCSGPGTEAGMLYRMNAEWKDDHSLCRILPRIPQWGKTNPTFIFMFYSTHILGWIFYLDLQKLYKSRWYPNLNFNGLKDFDEMVCVIGHH